MYLFITITFITIYILFLRYALWAAEFLLVWNYLENFAHCSVDINPCVLGVLRSRKINLFEYFTLRYYSTNNSNLNKHQWLHV